MTKLLATEQLVRHIHVIRGVKVMISQDLASLYKVEPRALVQAVKRNISRFPEDFGFQLTRQEADNLKSQSVISSWGGARRAPPFAFTEYGVVMLSSVLRSARANEVSIAVVRAFVHLRELLAGHRELARKLKALESKYDAQFRVVFQAIEQLMEEPTPRPARRIGFGTREDNS